MTQEESKQIDKGKSIFAKNYANQVTKWIDVNATMRDELAGEYTYKLSNLLISLNVGIIGATSFLLTNLEEIHWISKLLSLSLIFPIISIVLELEFKTKVIDINREACDRRVKFSQQLAKEDVPPLLEKKQKSKDELLEDINSHNEKTNQGFIDIMDWIKKETPKVMIFRKISKLFLILTLSVIIFIIFIEIFR
ncbi:hypothetical protein ACFL21_01990 [Patescibacteria group bacterium]